MGGEIFQALRHQMSPCVDFWGNGTLLSKALLSSCSTALPVWVVQDGSWLLQGKHGCFTLPCAFWRSVNWDKRVQVSKLAYPRHLVLHERLSCGRKHNVSWTGLQFVCIFLSWNALILVKVAFFYNYVSKERIFYWLNPTWGYRGTHLTHLVSMATNVFCTAVGVGQRRNREKQNKK